MLRVTLLAMERKLKGNIPSQHPVMTSLVECVADIVTSTCRVRMVGEATRGCLASRCTKKVWCLENEPGGESIGPMT